MPTYRYEALRPDGGRDEGVVDASSAAAAVAQLRRSYDAVLDLKELAAQLDMREYQQAVCRVGVVASVLHDAAAARRILHRYRERAPLGRRYLDGLRAYAVQELHRRGLRRSGRARAR